MYCVHCGKELNEKAVICPNCGIAVGSCGKEQPPAAGKTNALALWGFVLSLLQIIPWISVWCTALSFIFSLSGLKQCLESPERYTGKKLAVAGFILSCVIRCRLLHSGRVFVLSIDGMKRRRGMRKKTRCFTDGAENAREGGVPRAAPRPLRRKKYPGKPRKTASRCGVLFCRCCRLCPALTSLISRSLCRSSR